MASKQVPRELVSRKTPELDPIRVELTQAVPAVNVTVVAPAPLLVSEKTIGVEPKTARQLFRRAKAAGVAVTETREGLTALRADLEAWMRSSSSTSSPATSSPPPTSKAPRSKPANDAEASPDELLARAGLRLGGRR